jgi:ABC-type uncharacterized transport system ATPase subunit
VVTATLTDSTQIKERVVRDKVPEMATQLMQKYAVADLAIEETDISTVIEGIMREKRV